MIPGLSRYRVSRTWIMRDGPSAIGNGKQPLAYSHSIVLGGFVETS